MATIEVKLGAGRSLDLSDLDFSSLLDGKHYTAASKKFVIDYGDGDVVTLTGSGFKYDKDGYPTAGTVKTYSEKAHGFSLSLTGLKLSAKSLADAVRTFDQTDDDKLIQKVFKGDDKFTGGASDDTFNAFKGNDQLDGKGGNDWLDGSLGNDRLTGGSGHDTFVFNSGFDAGDDNFNVDTITDFQHDVDTIALSRLFFDAVGPTLDAAEFSDISKHKKQSDDRILYKSKTGDLYYDHDGKGGDPAIKFAHLSHHPHLTEADFIVF